VVARVEVFGAPDDGAHRLAWREHGTGCLDAVWRARWSERDREPGWIEARWRSPRDRPPPLGPAGTDGVDVEPVLLPLADAIDWISVEDQTGSERTGRILAYEHLTLWVGRSVTTLTVRHDQVDDLDAVCAAAAVAAHARLGTLD
jgi:hypothetical protein